MYETSRLLELSVKHDRAFENNPQSATMTYLHMSVSPSIQQKQVVLQSQQAAYSVPDKTQVDEGQDEKYYTEYMLNHKFYVCI